MFATSPIVGDETGSDLSVSKASKRGSPGCVKGSPSKCLSGKIVDFIDARCVTIVLCNQLHDPNEASLNKMPVPFDSSHSPESFVFLVKFKLVKCTTKHYITNS